MAMKIDPKSPVRSSAARRTEKSGGPKGGDFARHLEGPSNAGGVNSAAPLSGLDALVALQGIEEDSPQSKGRRRAEEILDRLDEIRQGLLAGSIPAAGLDRLVTVIRTQKAGVSDPRLAEILDEIDLRAQVELAKLDRDV